MSNQKNREVKELKHLIITDEVWLCFKIIDGYDSICELIEALKKEINGEDVDVDDMNDVVYNSFAYLTAKERRSKLILEEQIGGAE